MTDTEIDETFTRCRDAGIPFSTVIRTIIAGRDASHITVSQVQGSDELAAYLPRLVDTGFLRVATIGDEVVFVITVMEPQ